VIELSCILCDDTLIRPSDLPDIVHGLQQSQSHAHLLDTVQQLQLPVDGIDLPAFLDSIEWTLIQQALLRCDGNQVHAAALLGMTRDQLRYRLTAKRKRS
jgi:two-component system NtrC family response regulator